MRQLQEFWFDQDVCMLDTGQLLESRYLSVRAFTIPCSTRILMKLNSHKHYIQWFKRTTLTDLLTYFLQVISHQYLRTKKWLLVLGWLQLSITTGKDRDNVQIVQLTNRQLRPLTLLIFLKTNVFGLLGD